MQVILDCLLDSSFARPGSAPIWGGKKVEFRDWTRNTGNFKPECLVECTLLPEFRRVGRMQNAHCLFPAIYNDSADDLKHFVGCGI